MEIDQGAARAQASAGCPIPSCCWRCPDATRSGLGGVWRPPDGDPTVPMRGGALPQRWLPRRLLTPGNDDPGR